MFKLNCLTNDHNDYEKITTQTKIHKIAYLPRMFFMVYSSLIIIVVYMHVYTVFGRLNLLLAVNFHLNTPEKVSTTPEIESCLKNAHTKLKLMLFVYQTHPHSHRSRTLCTVMWCKTKED